MAGSSPCAQSSISSVVRCMARSVIGLSYGLRLGRVSLTAPFQVAAQFITGPMDIGLDRAQRQLQCGRDFLVGIALDVPEQDARPVLRPQPGNGPFDRG